MAEKVPISIFITTKNEQANLPYALRSVVDWAQEVFVLDSGSTDQTCDIAHQYGAHFSYRAWDGYARQKNWGLNNLPITQRWVFILDADEVITPALREELSHIASSDNCEENGFYVNRYFVFMGRRIRHCGYYPSWNIRFFRHGKALYEEREVHEHMIVQGKVGFLKHDMEHYDRRGLAFHIDKHNHYSTLEAREMVRVLRHEAKDVAGNFWGTPSERRKWVKRYVWPRLPARWFFRWLYMYVLKLGVLDGRTGFHFCLLMAAYEHQISLKMREIESTSTAVAVTPQSTDAVARGQT